MSENEKKDLKEEKSDNFSTELFKVMIENNKRSTSVSKTAIIAVMVVVALFLLYLYQYDFSSHIEQTGLYTFVDSEGNVISSDITPEEMKEILEIIDGKDKDN